MSAKKLSDIWLGWEIEKELGSGSYGKVYRAVRRERNLESYAAVKVISIPQSSSEVESLRDEGLSDEESRTYFQGIVDDFVNEIRLMQSFKGTPNIVSIEDYAVIEKADKIGWDIYIRMELLTPFNKYASSKTLTEDDIIKLGIDICSALELCGKRNIIHRDVKPENIFVNDFGFFKLGDFGIARKLENMTGGLTRIGTPNYMAPEVFIGNKYDASVDTYSLGLVMYKLLNKNRIPFLDTEKQLPNANDRANAVERRKSGEPLPPPCEASDSLAKIILKACAHNPNDRYKSAAEFKKALETIKTGGTIPVPPPAPPSPPPGNSSARSVIIASLVALAVLIGIGVFSWKYIKPTTKGSDETTTDDQTASATAAIPETTAASTEAIPETTDIFDMSGEPDETFTNGDFEVAVYGNNAVISKYIGSAEKVEIPSKINGYKVVAIGDKAFYDCKNLTKINIPDSVTSIGDYAFYDCINLTEISIPSSITTIGYGAFYWCASLTEISIPNSVTTIGERAFSGCYNLISFNVDKNNSNYCDIGGVLFSKDKTILIAYPSKKSDSVYTLPDGVTSIGDYAFYGCDNLTEINIPDSVASIGDYAFYLCDNLTDINIPDSVTTIGYNAFVGCDSLISFNVDKNNSNYCDIGGVLFSKDKTTLIAYPSKKSDSVYTIPDSVTSIGNYAFDGCDNLTEINIPDSVTTIGEWAFGWCGSLTEVIIPDSVTSIGEEAFYGCTNLTEVTIPDGVTSIGDYAFDNCTNLTKVIIPDSVTSIGDYAFYSCDSLTIYCSENSYAAEYAKNNDIPYSTGDEPIDLSGEPDETFTNGDFEVAVYGNNAVISKYISSAEKVEIPSKINGYKVVAIGEKAFAQCFSLTEISIPNSISKIDNYAFLNCHGLTEITIPDSVTEIGYQPFYTCINLAEINVNSSNKSYCDIDGVLFSKDKTTLVVYPCNKQESSYIIPNTVTSIDDHAFAYCHNITKIFIPDSVFTIGSYAFYFCTSLIEISISNSISKIDESTFANCSSLTQIILPDSVTTIGEHAFAWCHSLTEFTIPDSVSSVGMGAFESIKNLIKAYIPDSVTAIDEFAFWGCENLTIICNKDSYAAEYAKNNDIPYSTGDEPIDLSGEPDETFTNGDFEVAVYNGKAVISSYNGNAEKVEIPSEINGYPIVGIGYSAFAYCPSLVEITLPNNVTDITFGYCPSFTTINVDESHPAFSVIDGILFSKDKTKIVLYPCGKESTSYTIPEGVKLIGKHAFSCSANLERIYIPHSVTYIEDGSFANCNNLSEIIIPNSVISIGESAFLGCERLTEITIPDGVTSIGDLAFSYCHSLAEISISDSVTSIGDLTFYHDSVDLVIKCSEDSYAAEYAKNNAIKVNYN